MAKYSKKAQDKVEKTMHERKEGTLRSGSGKKVTSRKQAIAIGLSEAREAGAKVPTKASTSRQVATATKTTKKSSAKKSATKKAAPKKSASKKAASKKGSPKNSAKKSPAKKRATKK